MHFLFGVNILLNMNIVWTSCVIVSVIVLGIISPDQVLSVMVSSGSQSLKYAMELVAVFCVWLGVFSVAEKCNAVSALAKVFGKTNKKLFGSLSDSASNYIALNISSNLLGIGNAATPSGISAIKELEHTDTLSRQGAMLFVLNASGLQLIPTTVIGLRASCGSANASDILLPTLISTALTTVVGIILVNIGYGKAR